MVALVDTHCHLDARQFAADDVADIVRRAAAAGVTRLVTIGTTAASSRAAVALAEAHAAVWAAVGVDPHDAVGFADGTVDELRALAASPKVVAIGEIGLDYHWDRAPRPVQARVFAAQLDLAEELRLPVVIHNRDADADTAAHLLAWADRQPAEARPLGVLHCYSGDLGLAEELFAAGFLISFAGIVTFPNATRTQAVAAGLPDEAIVLETDSPYLSPQPFRGQMPNEPARVRAVAQCVAALRGQTVVALAAQTTANAARLFRWDGP
jgi:TatD DNase family protein